MSSSNQENRFWIYLEDALILLAIPVLWLTIFKLEGELCKWVQFITLVVMVVIFFRRIRRVRRAAGDE